MLFDEFFEFYTKFNFDRKGPWIGSTQNFQATVLLKTFQSALSKIIVILIISSVVASD